MTIVRGYRAQVDETRCESHIRPMAGYILRCGRVVGHGGPHKINIAWSDSDALVLDVLDRVATFAKKEAA